MRVNFCDQEFARVLLRQVIEQRLDLWTGFSLVFPEYQDYRHPGVQYPVYAVLIGMND
jgi:hypothetical protein